MPIGNLETEGDLEQWLKYALDRLGIHTGPARPPRFLTANLPAASAANEGLVVYVPDAAAGARFQGSTGSAWVPLG